MVGQIITIGMGQITQEPLTKRNATIVAIALGLGMAQAYGRRPCRLWNRDSRCFLNRAL
jgi:hypothetical protein